MAEQGAPNDTGKQGHHERNKVSGEGQAAASYTPATSGGEGELSGLDRDPDAPGDIDPGNDQGGPSMATRAADPSRSREEGASFAPGGDKTSQPGLKEDDLLDTLRGGRDEKPSDIPGRDGSGA